MPSKAILFPGQGAQFKGMGKRLFEKYPDSVETASRILGYSLRVLCLEDPHRQLHETRYTQPALYVVNALGYRQYCETNPEPPSYFAGHSLGEYNALLAAGAFDFETGLQLVQKRGELMATASGGGMLAVLDVSLARLQAFLADHALEDLDIANHNTPTQYVLSGPTASIQKAQAILAKHDLRCVVLNVSAAFHSRYMKDVQSVFSTFLQQFGFSALHTPVVSNVTGQPYRDSDLVSLLATQLSGSVLWTDSIQYLTATDPTMTFFEIGDRPLLSKMVEAIQKAPKRQPTPTITPTQLGSPAFREAYGIKYAYLVGAMYRGIASHEMVIALGRAGLMGFLGTGGMDLETVRHAIASIQASLSPLEPWGVNLLCTFEDPALEWESVRLYLAMGVTRIEAAAYVQMTPALVWFRVSGLIQDTNGHIQCRHQIVAKVSRPEVAKAFMSPPPEHILNILLEKNSISESQREWARTIPMSHDICVEADSGGHTDQGIPSVLLPAIQSLKESLATDFAYTPSIRIGLAGGIGTPQAAAAAFVMGADFILTGSINQCTVEAGISDTVKTMLSEMNVQDTAYAPAGDMFEMGAKIQVLKKGVLFPGRANTLYSLYRHYDSLDAIPKHIRDHLEKTYFKTSIDDIWAQTERYLHSRGRESQIHHALVVPKAKMAWVFRWYFGYSSRLTFLDTPENQVDYQIHTGPALGAFNQWVKGTPLDSWKNRYVAEIAEKIMLDTAKLLTERFARFIQER